METPQHVVVVLLDSLNRHMLGSYGGTEFATPNLDRFAARSTQFTNHVTGSLPCMPARHDILVGALDFLWKPWGSIELWEESITATLRRADVTTMLVSDHPHLFETGGENYHSDFSGVGLPARPRGRPVADLPRPIGVRRADDHQRRRRRLVPARPTRHRRPVVRAAPLRRQPHLVPRRGGLPRPAHDGRRDGVAAATSRRTRSLDAVRRRVRPARTVRHARAVGVDVRRRHR